MLKYNKKRSHTQARKLIFDLARYSDHSNHHMTDHLTDVQLEGWFAQNNKMRFSEFLRIHRDWDEKIPGVEQLLGAAFISDTGSAEVTGIDGTVVDKFEGGGMLVTSDYVSKFETFVKLKEMSIEQLDIDVFYSSLNTLFATFESYFFIKSKQYNLAADEENEHRSIRTEPLVEKLEDTKSSPVSLETKIKDWVPLFTENNCTIDFSKNSWALFKKYKNIRDKRAMHSKLEASAISFKEMALYQNELRSGPISILFELHKLMKDEAIAPLIRAVHWPDYYVEEQKK